METRQIKFRAWDKKRNEMFKVNSLNTFSDRTDNPMQVRRFQGDYSEDFVLMQFTGLLDKNGNEIYEGDVVHWKDGSKNPEHWRTGEVFYESNECCYHIRIIKCGVLEVGHVFGNNFAEWRENNELEIIGNIYSNPELLTQKQSV